MKEKNKHRRAHNLGKVLKASDPHIESPHISFDTAYSRGVEEVRETEKGDVGVPDLALEHAAAVRLSKKKQKTEKPFLKKKKRQERIRWKKNHTMVLWEI